MQLALNQLAAHLQKGVRPLYTLHGDEPLLQQEAADAIRAAARGLGYTERSSYMVAGAHFDWSAVLAAGGSLSLFADKQIVEIRIPRSRGHEPLEDIAGKADLVLVDAPCTGSGTWRRNPDAKWRVRPGALAERIKDQAEVLARAARLVRPGGRIAYITCSMLPEENDGAIRAFLGKTPGFAPVAPIDALKSAESDFSLLARFGTEFGLQLSPRRTGTDGFYLACLQRGD